MKRLFLFLIPGFVFAQGIVITPKAPVVAQEGSLTITADRPVVFNLSGTGWISNTTGTSTTYNAPATLQPVHTLNGCMVTPSDSVFNTRIDALPLASNSAAWAQAATSNPVSINYQWGTNDVDNTAPLTTQKFYYTYLLNGAQFPIPALPDKKREAGAYPTDGMNDHHMFVLNHESCQFYETYQEGNPNAMCPTCTSESGWTYNSTSYTQPAAADGGGATDAAGLPLGPLTLHLSEIKAGQVLHALRFTACVGCISHGVMWPATSSTGANPSSAPMGARFRLKSSFDISKYPPAAQVVLTALKHYGMFLADIGTTGQISASSDVTEDVEVLRELATIGGGRISPTNFEVVDESSLLLNANSSAVNPHNPYVRPSNQAVLTITDAANASNTMTVPIALQPITVGTTDPTMVVQAGTPAFKVPAWVNGTSNTALRWTASAGYVDANGYYTAPASVAGQTAATLAATSVADSTASTSIALTLIPSGTIRIDSGSLVPTTDPEGNTWLPEVGLETGNFNDVNDTYPIGAWGNIADPVQTESNIYTWGDDITYKMHLPNGNYNVTMMFGMGDCAGTYYTGVRDNGLVIGPLNIEAQGKLAYAAWDYVKATANTCRLPTRLVLPAQVTDNTLKLAVRSMGGNNALSTPSLNSLQVAPFAGLPYLLINTQQNIVQPGSSLQLGVTRFFVNPSTPITWRIEAGGGTVTQTGLYTAPAYSATTQFVRIRVRAGSAQGSFTMMIPASKP